MRESEGVGVIANFALFPRRLGNCLVWEIESGAAPSFL